MIFVFGRLFQTEYYLYLYVGDFSIPDIFCICICLKFGNRIVKISPQVKISNYLFCLEAQKTQYDTDTDTLSLNCQLILKTFKFCNQSNMKADIRLCLYQTMEHKLYPLHSLVGYYLDSSQPALLLS